jgi:hypothetical protein
LQIFISEINTRNLPVPLLVFMLVVATVAVLYLYRKDLALVSPRTRQWLVGLRLAEVVLLILLLADPVRMARQTVIEKGVILLFADTSRSFALKDPYRPQAQREKEARALHLNPDDIRDTDRRSLVARAFESGWLDELSRDFRVFAYSLAEDLRPVNSTSLEEGGQIELPAATESGTNLAQPLAREVAEAVQRTGGAVAGVVLFTDGNHHAEGDPRAAARRLALLGVPCIAIGVGALQKPPDLDLQALDATGKVFTGDDVEAQVTIAAAGLPQVELPLTVHEGGKVVKNFLATIPAGETVARLPISFPAGDPGRKKFTVSFPLQEGEVSPANNTRDLWLEVLSERARVLLLDGGPRWEERYLKSTWSRDENVELQSFLVVPPPERRLPASMPRSRGELFTQDLLVLGDVDPAVFSREERESLRDFVTVRGGTLVLLCGARSMPYRWAGTPLEEVLPVKLLEPAPSADLGATLAREKLPLTLTPTGEVSAMTRLIPGRERNLELWELLPQSRWLNPIAGLKPGAEVLVTLKPGAGDPDDRATRLLAERGAVFVTHAFGAGQVLYAGIDSTWRWRFRLGDELHRRFWGQVVRWAVSDQLSGADEFVRLGTNALLYETGAPVTIKALVKNEDGTPCEDKFVDAVIEGTADGKKGRLRLEPVPRSEGRYRGEASLAEIGLRTPPPGTSGTATEYRVLLDVPALAGYNARADRAVVAFVVQAAPDPEERDVSCNVELLEDLASITGGEFLPFSRFREAINILKDPSRPDRSKEVERVTESSLWNHPLLVAVALLGFLAAEWILRKRRDLV